ncbi:MAG: hypothetical protein IIC83_02710 [Chloroflexi bacterium]|nr:hypothetical protein [Chloroflexota bacterium]
MHTQSMQLRDFYLVARSAIKKVDMERWNTAQRPCPERFDGLVGWC